MNKMRTVTGSPSKKGRDEKENPKNKCLLPVKIITGLQQKSLYFKNGKVNMKTVASFPSLLLRFPEGNSLYSIIVTVTQL